MDGPNKAYAYVLAPPLPKAEDRDRGKARQGKNPGSEPDERRPKSRIWADNSASFGDFLAPFFT
jgi:hypothetical protein